MQNSPFKGSKSLVLGYQFPGGLSRGDPPDSIPNSEVKPSSADGTAAVTLWESRSSPGLFLKSRFLGSGFFFVFLKKRFAEVGSADSSGRGERRDDRPRI